MPPKAVVAAAAGGGGGSGDSKSSPAASTSSGGNTPAVVSGDETVRTMIASSMAGMIARIPMHPIDTCKAKIQVQTTPGVYRNFVDCLIRTYRSEGLRGLYPGFGVTFLGSGPAMALYWTSYETAKSVLTHPSSPLRHHTFAAHFSAGLIAECFSCVLWVPIDVVKERLQVQSNIKPKNNNTASATATAAAAGGKPTNTHAQPLHYRGNVDAIVKIWRHEGLRGVYKGYFATVASFGPFSAIYLSTYEQFKSFSMRTLSRDESRLPFGVSLLNGCAAGSVASVLTNALDMSKLRIQVQRANHAFTFNYSNVFQGVWQIAKTEGLRGLFKGAGARVAFHAPSTAITMATLEECKKFLNRFDRFKPKK